jgi:hypothetical protein
MNFLQQNTTLSQILVLCRKKLLPYCPGSTMYVGMSTQGSIVEFSTLFGQSPKC